MARPKLPAADREIGAWRLARLIQDGDCLRSCCGLRDVCDLSPSWTGAGARQRCDWTDLGRSVRQPRANVDTNGLEVVARGSRLGRVRSRPERSAHVLAPR